MNNKDVQSNLRPLSELNRPRPTTERTPRLLLECTGVVQRLANPVRLAVLALERMFLGVLLPIIIITTVSTTITSITITNSPKQSKQMHRHPSFKHRGARAQKQNKQEMKESERTVEDVETGEVGVVKLKLQLPKDIGGGKA